METFTKNILNLRAKQITSSLSEKEAILLAKINQNLENNISKKYQNLIIKRNAENLTDKEYQDLSNLTDIVEKHQWERLNFLKELAIVRSCSLSDLMKELKIKPIDYER